MKQFELVMLPNGNVVARDVTTPEWLAEQRRRNANPLLAAADVPSRIQQLLQSPWDTVAHRRVRVFMAETQTFLLLVGGVGTGKSAAACSAVLEAPSARYIKAAVTFGEKSSFDEDYWDGLRNIGLLIIDDLGTEPLDDKGWASAKIDSLIDSRYDWQRKTIITTNSRLEDLKARYLAGPGARTLDRIREAGSVFVIPGASLREARHT